jgi:3-keto steroid reductase
LPQKFSLRDFSKDVDDDASAEYEGLILIMACRNAKRAEAAKERLFQLLDIYIEGLKKNVDEYVHAKKFREVVEIQVHDLDLSVMNSVFKFAEEISQQ